MLRCKPWTAKLLRLLSNGIVEAVRLAVQSYAAGENSYRSVIVKVLDGPAAYLWALDFPGLFVVGETA